MKLSPLSAALVLSSGKLREEAIGCINHLPIRIALDQRQLDDPEELLDQIERHRVDVVLLEGSLMRMPLEEMARRLRLTASDPVIFILQEAAVPEQILEAMQAGAREYLCPPLAGPLKDAFQRLAAVRGEQVSTQQRKLGRIYGFLSAKGGCGATTFASHVATAAARQTGAPVLLGDLDFEASLLRFILKAKTRYSLRDALDNMHRMDSSYWQALIVKHGDNLDFISAPEDLTERIQPDPRHLTRLLRFIRATYPITVFDYGRWYSAPAMDSLAEMESLFVVVTQDLLVLENAKEILRLGSERGKGADRIKILLNRAAARPKPDLDGFEKYLGVRPHAVFSDESEALYESWSEGRLLGNETPFGSQLLNLARTMVQKDTDETAARQSSSKPVAGLGGLGRLFSKIAPGKAPEAAEKHATGSQATGQLVTEAAAGFAAAQGADSNPFRGFLRKIRA